jgi:uncharacterized PurR-regulated membrane protein YhhQ (DUF165 family)
MKLKITAALGFIATILAANYVTTKYGMVPVGFGLVATAGTYFAGLAFVLRDSVQDLASQSRRGTNRTRGRLVVAALIVIGSALSFAISAPGIATASAVAFLLSETADFAVYTPLRKRGYILAALASNLVGAVVDTVIFLAIAGFSLREAFWGQVVGKLIVTLAVAIPVAAVRYSRRPVTV